MMVVIMFQKDDEVAGNLIIIIMHLIISTFQGVNRIKYNTILFYIIYKRERLKSYR